MGRGLFGDSGLGEALSERVGTDERDSMGPWRWGLSPAAWWVGWLCQKGPGDDGCDGWDATWAGPGKGFRREPLWQGSLAASPAPSRSPRLPQVPGALQPQAVLAAAAHADVLAVHRGVLLRLRPARGPRVLRLLCRQGWAPALPSALRSAPGCLCYPRAAINTTRSRP